MTVVDPIAELELELDDIEPAELARVLARVDDQSIDLAEQVVARHLASRSGPDRYFPTARDKQRAPDGLDWLIWLIMAGRGFGKSLTGSEWIVEQAITDPGWYAVVAPTFTSGRDLCFEGKGEEGNPSGILSVLDRRGWQLVERMPRDPDPHARLYTWNRSMGELRLANRARIQLYSAEKPDRLRGPNLKGAWVDELGAWEKFDAWDQLRLAVRIGPLPRIVVTTTPRPVPPIRKLVKQFRGDPDENLPPDPTVAVTRGTTLENADNLSEKFIADMADKYAGTRLGRQELAGELLDDVEGALWKLEDVWHVREVPKLVRIMVGIDPSTWGEDTGDEHTSVGQGLETGLVVVGLMREKDAQGRSQLAVLEDLSGRFSPDEWGRRACTAWRRWSAHAPTWIVPETNAGGGMVTSTIRLVDPNARIHTEKGKAGVRASKGKRARAEPVAALYEQHRVVHVGTLAVLEDQMCVPRDTMVPTGRGVIAVQDVRAGDTTWTRQGWRPIVWAGVSGVADRLIRLSHELGCVLCTPEHPVWVEGRGFVPAQHVRPSDRLLVAPSLASTARPSRGGAAGGIGCPAGTSATAADALDTPRASSFTASRTRRTSDRSPAASSSTIATRTPEITGRGTWSPSLAASTRPSTTGRASAPRSRARAGLRDHLSAASALWTGESSGPAGSVRPVVVLANDELAIDAQPVYDLTVDGAPEFLADGVLIHNCTWDARENWSPDRIDALVWAVTALKPWGGVATAGQKPRRSPQRPRAGAKAIPRARRAGRSGAPMRAAGAFERLQPPGRR